MGDRYRRVLFPYLSARGKLWFDPALAWSEAELKAKSEVALADYRHHFRLAGDLLAEPHASAPPLESGWNPGDVGVISPSDARARSEPDAEALTGRVVDLEPDERRRMQRRLLLRPILVVPAEGLGCLDCLNANLPDPVIGRDISGTGVAWVSTRRPEPGKLIVGLGAIDGRPLRFEAVAVRIALDGRGRYRVGARWLRRLPE